MEYYYPRRFVNRASPMWKIFAFFWVLLFLGIIFSFNLFIKVGGFLIGFFVLFWVFAFWFMYNGH